MNIPIAQEVVQIVILLVAIHLEKYNDRYLPPTTYTLTATAGVGGTVTTALVNTIDLDSETTVTLTATANSGYEFVDWNDGNTQNPRTVIVISYTNFTANFEGIIIPDVPPVITLHLESQTLETGETLALSIFKIKNKYEEFY